MKGIRGAIAAAAILASASARAEPPSRQQIFCAELRRVVEVAELGGDFTYLERSRAAPPSLGFRNGCQATGDEKRHYWHCGQSLAPEEMSRDALAARIAECLRRRCAPQAAWRETPSSLCPTPGSTSRRSAGQKSMSVGTSISRWKRFGPERRARWDQSRSWRLEKRRPRGSDRPKAPPPQSSLRIVELRVAALKPNFLKIIRLDAVRPPGWRVIHCSTWALASRA